MQNKGLRKKSEKNKEVHATICDRSVFRFSFAPRHVIAQAIEMIKEHRGRGTSKEGFFGFWKRCFFFFFFQRDLQQNYENLWNLQKRTSMKLSKFFFSVGVLSVLRVLVAWSLDSLDLQCSRNGPMKVEAGCHWQKTIAKAWVLPLKWTKNRISVLFPYAFACFQRPLRLRAVLGQDDLIQGFRDVVRGHRGVIVNGVLKSETLSFLCASSKLF